MLCLSEGQLLQGKAVVCGDGRLPGGSSDKAEV